MNDVAWQAFFTNPGLYVLLVVLTGAGLLIQWLFRRTVAAERQRAEDWKELYNSEHETATKLLLGLQASSVVAETTEKFVKALPSREE